MSDKRKRQQAIRFRVTADEDKLIRKHAQDEMLPVANFARAVVLAAATGAIETTNEKSEAIALRTIISELNRIAAVMEKRSINTDDATRIVDELRRLQLLVFRFHYDESAT